MIEAASLCKLTEASVLFEPVAQEIVRLAYLSRNNIKAQMREEQEKIRFSTLNSLARFAKPTDLSDVCAEAIYLLQHAVIHEPFYAAGHGTVVSELNQVTQGAMLAKTGAGGVLTAALPE